LGEFVIETDHQHGVDTERVDLANFGSKRREAKRVTARLKISPWMRLERHRDQRCRCGTRDFRRSADNGLMAAMDAIEISDDDGRAGQVGWDVFEVPQNAHVSFVSVQRIRTSVNAPNGCV